MSPSTLFKFITITEIAYLTVPSPTNPLSRRYGAAYLFLLRPPIYFWPVYFSYGYIHIKLIHFEPPTAQTKFDHTHALTHPRTHLPRTARCDTWYPDASSRWKCLPPSASRSASLPASNALLRLPLRSSRSEALFFSFIAVNNPLHLYRSWWRLSIASFVD